MKKLFRYRTFLEILFIFFLSLTPLLWFERGTIIVGHDNVFAIDPVTFLQGRLFTWVDHGFGQSQDLIMGTIPIHLIDAIPYVLGLPFQATEMAVYVFWFFLIGISAYILARQFREQSWVFRLLVVILYQFNFFLLQGWWIGERTKFSAYIALPLIFTLFLRVHRGETSVFKSAVLVSLIFFVFNAGGLYGIPLYGGLFISLFVFLLLFGFLDLVGKNFASLRRTLLLTVFCIIGYAIVNSYFTFPAVSRLNQEYNQGVVKAGGVEGLLAWADEISANASLINLLRLEGIAEWYDNPDHPYAKVFLNNPFFIVLSFIWPLIIILSFTRDYGGKRKIILLFFIIFLVGIFLSSGTHRPFGVVYEAFMKYIPGFAAFRSPYFKFASAIFFAASFLIAFYIDSFGGKKKYVFFALALAFVFLYHFPYFTGDIFSWRKGFSTRLAIPSYVIEFGKWLEEEKKDDGRVLFLPPNSPNWRYSIYDWGYLSFQALPTLLSNKSTVINNDRLNDNERKLVDALYDSFANDDSESINKLSSYLGVKYFILQDDTIAQDSSSPLSLNVRVYKDMIEEKLRLKPIKDFGRWSLYELDTQALPTFYTASDLTVISGPVKNFSYYYDFLEEKRVLLKNNDLTGLNLSPQKLPDIYSPSCLKCTKKDRPFIVFPQRSVLPNSPFYPLVLLSENRNLRSQDPRTLVYDYLGLSMKRLSEINEMIEKDISISGDVISRYEATVRLIHTNFNKLVRLEDKYSAAEDLTYYIRSQRDLVYETLADEVSGLPAVILDRALKSLRTLDQGIKPYVFTRDITQNRLYNISVAQPDVYSLYIRTAEFGSVVRPNADLSVEIDSKQSRTLTISDESFQGEWLSFGNFTLSQGDHTFLLSFSELENKVLPPQPSTTVFNADGRQRCFTTKVENYDNRKRYKAIVRYRNDLFNDINIYIWEDKEKEQRLRFASRLFKSLIEEEFTHEIDPQGDIRGIILGFCSTNLTQEFIRERFSIKVSELIDPVVLFLSKNEKDVDISNVSYQRINPSKYSVSFSTTNPNTVLVFNSRIDEGWELQGGFKKHILVNGFANGWLIEQPGNYSLILEYKPQDYYLVGGFLSLSAVLGGVSYILWNSIKRRKKYD